MAAINERNLNDLNENLRNTHSEDDVHTDQLPENTGSDTLESSNPYHQAEDPLRTQPGSLSQDEAFGENSGILSSDSITNSDQTRGPGGDDEDFEDDDDDLLDEDDEDTLIPIEGDEEDDGLLSADEDDDVIPGTDMDDGDDLLDDDDELDDDSGVNRSSMGDMGSNVSGRNDGRSTGRMIDHEPGTSGI